MFFQTGTTNTPENQVKAEEAESPQELARQRITVNQKESGDLMSHPMTNSSVRVRDHEKQVKKIFKNVRKERLIYTKETLREYGPAHHESFFTGPSL